MNIQELKKLRPHYEGLDDQQIVQLVQRANYPDNTVEEVADALGVKLAPPAAPEEVAPKRNAFGFVNDQMINAANAAVGTVKSVADLVAPDSAVSGALEEFIKSGKEKQSDKQKFLDRQLEGKLREAEGGWEKAGQYVKHAITEDLPGTLAQAVGNIGPFAALGKGAKVIGVGNAARTATMMGAAGAAGAGEVRGNIWEKISSTPDAQLQAESPEYLDLRINGMSEAQAKQQIGANFMRNLPEVAAVGALSALGGKFGVEGMAGRVAPSMGRITGAGVGLLDEGIQGATEQLASNVGVQRALPGQSLMEDVPLNAAMEGMAGGIGGLVAGGSAQPKGPMARAAAAAAPDPLAAPVTPDPVLPDPASMDHGVANGLSTIDNPQDLALSRMHDQAAKDLQDQRDFRSPLLVQPAQAVPTQLDDQFDPEPRPRPSPRTFGPESTTPEGIRESLDEVSQRNEQTRKLYAPLMGDILNPKGEPFKNETAAKRAQKKAGGGDVVTVEGGWVVRPAAQDVEVKDGNSSASSLVPFVSGDGRRADTEAGMDDSQRNDAVRGSRGDDAGGSGAGDVRSGRASSPDAAPALDAAGRDGQGLSPIAGEKIDSDWTAFSPESGTLAIPRADMPQVKAEHRGAMVQFLKGKGIEHEQDEVAADSLKPTQVEFSPAKVAKAGEFAGGDRSILVSSDGHVLDGHHQWVAKREAGEPVKVIRLKAPIKELLEQVKAFPSSDLSDGAAPGSAAAVEVQQQAQPVDTTGEGDGGSRSQPTASIQDVGEKIGGARKDAATTAGRRGHTAKRDDRPGWKKRYTAMQSVKDAGQGKEVWHLVDAKTGRAVRGSNIGAMAFESEAAAEAAIPMVEVARNHRVSMDGEGRFVIKRDVSDRKRVQVVQQVFSNREDAMQYLQDHAVEIIETKTSFGEEILAKPETVMREGAARRSGDAKGDDFIRDFGLRGVEFGNWNNQDERQQVMNHAFDALHDLADVLGVPAKALGLGGQLGLAFGARGHGLSGARAHYEVDYGVINLTKMSGAGSLAHEWFHAMDHYFARQDGKAASERETNDRGNKVFKRKGVAHDMASHGFQMRNSNVRPEVRQAYENLIKVMFSKGERYVEELSKAEAFIGRAKIDVADALQGIRNNLANELDRSYYKRNFKPATAGQLAEFDGIAERIIAGQSVETQWRTIPGSRSMTGSRWTNDALERLGAIIKAVRGRSGFTADRSGTLDGLRNHMARYSERLKMLASAQSGTEKTKMVPTDFAMGAKEVDQGRASDYWTTPHEMAARAFEAYVQDQIDARGGSSDFLVFGTRGAVPTPWGWAQVYPMGEERKAINQAFDEFLSKVETREDDAGNVVMFSRRTASGNQLPDALIGGRLADMNNHPSYTSAKAGDALAGLKVAQDLVTDDLIAQIKAQAGEGAVFVPVISEEATGRNKIPQGVAEVLAHRLQGTTTTDIVQGNAPKRTALGGLDRVLAQPYFEGEVKPAARYVLVDDAITQGGTFAALASHIKDNGGEVVGVVALTGKQYSAKLAPSSENLQTVRERYADIEPQFQAATGYGFDALTESEARYLAKHDDADAVRARILEDGSAAVQRDDEGSAEEGDVAAFKRSGARRESPEVVAAVRQVVDEITGTWANPPSVTVLASFDDAPDAVKAKNAELVAGGSNLEPDAFLFGERIYLLAGRINQRSDVQRLLFHEGLGHIGLRSVFGDNLDGILDQMWKARRREVQSKADAYGLDTSTQDGRRQAAEELLAEWAETRPTLGFVARAVAAVRTWLRKHVKALGKMSLTDDEIRANFLVPARNFIERGRSQSAGSLTPAFSRSQDDSMLSSAPSVVSDAFKRWFGDSKVVDADGKPLVMYHGTSKSEQGDAFSSFDTYASNYGLMGMGGYFTDDPAVASSYTTKGKGGSPTVYPVFLSIKNPIDMDAKADADQWVKQFPDADAYVDGDTNEAWYRAAEDSLTDQMLPDYEGAEIMQEGLRAMGFDGITHIGGGRVKSDGVRHRVFIAFDPEQIKSATGNRGTFDPANSDIRFSRSAVGTMGQQARQVFADFVGDAGAKVSFLDRTIKTQYAKAQKFPAFRKVFDKLQDYIEGISSFANQAADKAPDILPRLESWRDLKRGGIDSLLRHGLSQADAKHLAGPVFEGTLLWSRDANGKLIPQEQAIKAAESMSAEDKAQEMLRASRLDPGVLRMWRGLPLDQFEASIESRYEKEMLRPGVVFTDAELKDKFGSTPEQIQHYRQFRAAVDASLDQVVAADVIRMLGDQAPPSIRALLDSERGIAGLRQTVEKLMGQEADANEWNKVADKFNRVDDLKARGYAPLSRFGKFFVHVIDADGQTQYFGLEESGRSANRLARDMAQAFGSDVKIEQGVMSQEAHKLMSAVPIDAMELFADAIGADESEVFQKYIQLAKSNRSTLTRLLQRKGRAGFSADVPRVLASFITSNARAASAGLHIKDAKESARVIMDGDVKDEAIKLIESVTEPVETGSVVRGMLFANFIGGSIASAVTNMTQPIMMTLPYLSQWGGMVKASGRLVAAAKLATTKIMDRDLREAVARAERDGVVSPQEIHHLMRQASSGLSQVKVIGPSLQKLAFLWGAPFSLAETFNRRVSFIAAYQTAVDEGMDDPFTFAERAVKETQGLYNAGNRPNVSRSVAGSMAMTFKQYSIHYLEWLGRMYKSGPEGKRAVAWAIALLILAAGGDGLPFMDDLDDVVDTVGQYTGHDMNLRRSRRQFIESVLGEELGEVATRGFSAAAGFPVDLSLRMGMGNLLPATELLLKSNDDPARSIAEVAGAGGSLFIQYRDAIIKMLSGDVGAALIKVSPVALQNLARAGEMAATGEYRNQRDQKVMDVDGLDAGMKALSFQPAAVARESAMMGESRRSEQLAKTIESEIAGKWARAIADGDDERKQAAIDELKSWNEKNPDMPIKITPSQIRQRVRKLRQSRAERYVTTVAPERRAALKAQ